MLGAEGKNQFVRHGTDGAPTDDHSDYLVAPELARAFRYKMGMPLQADRQRAAMRIEFL